MSNDFIQNAVNNLYRDNELMALKAENARLRSSSFTTAVPSEEYEKMKAENTRLHSQFANSEQENARLKAEVNELAEGLKLASEVGIKIADEVTRLKAEVERLEPELEQRCRELNLSLAQQAIQLRQIGELKAEVERLRKAGDWMREALEEGPIDYQCRIDRWNAAKEGKPTIGLLSPREHWELSNGKSVGSDDTWESYCQRMHADIARWVHAAKEGKPSV